MSGMPFYRRVEHESVYYLTPKRALRIPTPPTMRNSGNYVASLSQLGRWLAERAEEAGAAILPETSGHALLVGDGRVRGVRTGDRGRGRGGEELGTFVAGDDVHGDLKRTALRDVGGWPRGGERRSRWEGIVRSLSS